LTSIAVGFAPGLRRKQSQVKIWAVALISMMLVGCAATPVPLHTQRLFRDHLFAAPPPRISADDVFAFNDDMKQYLSTHIARQFRSKDPWATNTRCHRGNHRRDVSVRVIASER
jgi:hypothetical protein